MPWFEDLLGFCILSILGFVILNLQTLLAIAIAIIIIISLSLTFYLVFSMGNYPPLLNKEITLSTGSCQTGEYIWEKIGKIYLANYFIGIFFFISLLYLLNTLPILFTSIPTNTVIKKATIGSIVLNLPLSHIALSQIAFNLTFYTVPATLLSLRILANPGDYLNSIICKNIHLLSAEKKDQKFMFFKEQILSLYFSFIATTIAIFGLGILFTAVYYNDFAILNILATLVPTNTDEISFVFLISLEVVSIFIVTVLGEWILKMLPPHIKD